MMILLGLHVIYQMFVLSQGKLCKQTLALCSFLSSQVMCSNELQMISQGNLIFWLEG